jgi:hypothetical protein
MRRSPHVEGHFRGGATVRDIVIGVSDGPTVPFALAAGLSGGKGHFTGTTPLRSALQAVVIGGLAAGAAFGIARAVA